MPDRRDHGGHRGDYLRLPTVGGSWLTPADALAAGDWARILTATVAHTR
jgi:2-keto-3-deoxy-6-phosphogluconate aldolase